MGRAAEWSHHGNLRPEILFQPGFCCSQGGRVSCIPFLAKSILQAREDTQEPQPGCVTRGLCRVTKDPASQGSAPDVPSSPSPAPQMRTIPWPMTSILPHSSPSPLCPEKWLWAAGKCPPQGEGPWSPPPRVPFHPPALWLCTNAPPLLPRAGNCRRTEVRVAQVLAPLRNSKMEPTGLWGASQISHPRLHCCLRLQALGQVRLQGIHFQGGPLAGAPGATNRTQVALKMPDQQGHPF